MADATDYNMTDAGAECLKATALLPRDMRAELLNRYRRAHGTKALVELFAQFIGLANSVVANNREAIELFGIIEGGMHPHHAEQLNLPTIFGALCGVALANGIDQAETCGGCAFRQGTCANQSPSTTIDADWCQKDEGRGEHFWCHEDMREDGTPSRVCAGYAQRVKAARKESVHRPATPDRSTAGVG